MGGFGWGHEAMLDARQVHRHAQLAHRPREVPTPVRLPPQPGNSKRALNKGGPYSVLRKRRVDELRARQNGWPDSSARHCEGKTGRHRGKVRASR
jgi:hypothetical protein